MTREQAVEELEAIASDLESDVRLCQTRTDHVRASRRLAQVRDLAERLRAG